MSKVPHNDVHDQGLAHDLHLLTRRRLLWFLGGAALVPVIASCTQIDSAESGVDAAAGSGSGSGSGSSTGGTCSTIPQETAGPYPGDGTNGANALTLTGIVRSDITTSLTSSKVAAGIPLTVTLTIVKGSTCEPAVGYAVYIWHCDRDGNYSMYSNGVTADSYLRGVQVTDANGQVSFTTIWPACYSGRWPHIHFEVYTDVAAATSGNNKVSVSQLAMPKAQCDEVFATTGYSQSVTNLSQVSLASDMVFSDGATQETPAVTGSTTAGYSASLYVPIG
jgi:protocatechuate 3,4-dioxygenase beta subunit